MAERGDKEQGLALFRAGEVEGARTAFRRYCTANPEDAEGWLLLGLCQRGLGEREEAILSLHRSARMTPDSADADAALGRTHMDLLRFEEAVAAFREGLAKEGDHEDCLLGLPEALLHLARFREAEAAAREGLRHYPGSATLHAQLATALEQTHRLEEARAEAERAAELAPGEARPELLLARLDRRQGRLEEARERLERLLAAGGNPQLRATVAADLGQVLHRLGRYGEAFAAFAAGNEAMAATVDRERVDVDRIFAVIDHRRAAFEAVATQGWGEEEPEDGVASPAFLVGFPRSGTTLTGQILASHPQVAVTGQQPLLGRLIGELPNLLGRRLESGWDLCDLGAEELTRVRRRYWALVAEMVGPVEADRLLVDKLPLNLIDLGFAYRFFPRAKVVVLLRDPRDACLSCFMQPFHLNQANVNFLDLERTARLYAAVMELWFHYREALGNPYLELRYEELVADPEGRARELLAFLGLPWDEAVLRFHELGREVRTPSYAAVASPIYREAVGRWRHYREQLAPVAGILQPFVEAFGYESEGG